VAEAAHIMSSYNVSSIVAEYQKRLVGILTERDLLKRVVALSKNPARTRVADVMSFPVTSVPPSYSILSASNMMEKMHVHRLVIVDGKKACGIVTQTDIMWAVRSELERRGEERQGLIAELLVRRCPECAAPLGPRQRYCLRCTRKRSSRTRREHQKECRKTQRLSVG